MKKISLLLLISVIFGVIAPAQPVSRAQNLPPRRQSPLGQPYWQQQTDFTINVSLNDIEHTLDGLEKIKYTNNSPDTLFFIWFHCWPNAYKNDQTAFSEQLLGNDRTDFYFSDKQQRGYINRLNFRVDGITARMEDHPQYIDILKLELPAPLAPGKQIEIVGSFHEQLPENFSRGGHIGQSYQVTQWYPKPAVYDREGWHPMPYLDQGDVYSEYGDYDVTIHLPANYGVAATGELIEGDAGAKKLVSAVATKPVNTVAVKPATSNQPKPAKPPLLAQAFSRKEKSLPRHIPSDTVIKTLRFRQSHVQDFAWFADKNFQRDQDTLQLKSGRVVLISSFHAPGSAAVWKNSIRYAKDAIRFRSSALGEYPFPVLTLVEWKGKKRQGMEYPGLIAIAPPAKGFAHSFEEKGGLALRIEHQIGFTWFGDVLGSDRRRYPWMFEGMNAYYDRRYQATIHPSERTLRNQPKPCINPFIPSQPDDIFASYLIDERLDQPMASSSTDFTAANYRLMAGAKTAGWMKLLEDSLGKNLLDSFMAAYYQGWQFRHPYPEDFYTFLNRPGEKDLTGAIGLLYEKGPLPPHRPKKIYPGLFYPMKNTDRIEYINIQPAIGYNEYDKFMIGGIVHNYAGLPSNPFQFFVTPMYATNSKQLTGLGRLSYTIYPGKGHSPLKMGNSANQEADLPNGNTIQNIEFSLAGARFSTLSARDSNARWIFGGFYKIVPSVRLTFKKPYPRSSVEKWIDFKTYLIGEKSFDYLPKSSNSQYYPVATNYAFRYLNQLSLNLDDDRVLYPYNAQLQFQQASRFYRVNFTGNYFFNYASGGGMAVRIFAAKFGYLGGKSTSLDLSEFEPKLTGVRGNEDYTYSNYFLGRNEFSGFANQQVMIRDGGLKIQVPLFPYLEGRSDNWVAATNFATTLPANLFPRAIPLKVFLDIGTYSGGWQPNPQTSKFLYVGGLQLSLLHNIVNFYAPIFYSSDFGDQLKTIREGNSFWKKISFSIDVQNINFKKIVGKTITDRYPD